MALVGTTELLLIGAGLVALVVGPKKLPEMARSLGRSKKEFYKSMEEAEKFKSGAEDAADQLEDAAEDVKKASKTD